MSFTLITMRLLLVALVSALMAVSVRAQTFYGLNYGIDSNNCPSVESMTSDFNKIKKYTNRVRTFSLSVCNQGKFDTTAFNRMSFCSQWLSSRDGRPGC